MNKKSVWLIGLIILFAVITITLGFLNADKASKIDNEVLTIKSPQKSIELALKEIMAFDKVTFEALVKSSGNEPETTEFGGVLLYDVLVAKGIILSEEQMVVFKALDGYQTNVSALEVKQADNIYIVYERNGERTANRTDGGTGPLEIVVAQDPFSQRWNKYLIEIEIKP
jgi:hypothetical protein